MSQVPSTWATTPLLSVSQLLRGVTYTKDVAATEPGAGLLPIVRANNLQGRAFDLRDLVFVPGALVSAQQRIRAGDVVIATSSGSINVVGKAVQARTDMEAGFGAFCGVLRPDPALEPRFFGHFFSTEAYRTRVSAMARGSNINNLKREHFDSLRIAIAPHAEQKRIADKLDTVLARVDAVNDRLARAAPLLKRFRQSVLAAATSGRLTEDWRRNLKRLIDKDGLPPNWEAATIASAAVNQDYLRRPISEVERRGRRGDFRYFGASGAIDTIDGFTHEGEFLLVGEDGANLLARSKPIAFTASGRIWVNNHAHVLTHANAARLAYLSFAINAIDLSPWVTGSAQPKLTRKAMDSIPVLLPPDDEQDEIVRRVESLFAFADRLEARLQAAQTATERLTPSLLATAFRGELVPQDPNDEPASELLRRLQAQAPTSPAKRGRKRSA